MYLQIESQRALPRITFGRFAEWWPVALLGLTVLMGGLPDANAQSLLGL